MATILEPSVVSPLSAEETTALLKENYLSEFETDDEKSAARANLDVHSKEAVYTKETTRTMINEKISEALEGYVTKLDLPGELEGIVDSITSEGYVKADGSVPFTAPQEGVYPVDNADLVTKLYSDSKLSEHVKADDPHGTLAAVESELGSYAKSANVYSKSESYSAKEVDTTLKDYVKRDGSTGFTAPQCGKDPELPSHLATSRYVGNVMDEHKSEVDAHGINETISSALKGYAKSSNVYNKASTYSRSEVQELINSQVDSIVNQAIDQWKANDGSVAELRDEIAKELLKYVKADGSVAFSAPQEGQRAENCNELVTLCQMEEAVSEAVSPLEEKVEEVAQNNVWVPSGPVQTTVGYVEDNSVMPSSMTLQQVCDAIFYGKTTGVSAPDYVEGGEQVCVTVHVPSTGTLVEADLYMNGDLVGEIYPEDFVQSDTGGWYYEYCVESLTEDTEWKVEITYSGGETVTDTATTKISQPIFIGMVPYWWNAQEDITMKSLRKLAEDDPQNCAFQTHEGLDISSVTMDFSFEDSSGRSLVVVIPYDYPDLGGMTSEAQSVSADAFAKWVQPMYPDNSGSSVMYKIYVFNQTLYFYEGSMTISFSEHKD